VQINHCIYIKHTLESKQVLKTLTLQPPGKRGLVE